MKINIMVAGRDGSLLLFTFEMLIEFVSFLTGFLWRSFVIERFFFSIYGDLAVARTGMMMYILQQKIFCYNYSSVP